MMVGLGVKGDRPPSALQPQLKDGIHLRWAFKRELGFPWYGYYLFRRDHRRGTFARSNLIRVIDRILKGKHYRLCNLEEPAYRIRIRFEFQASGKIEVAALLWDTPVDKEVIEAETGQTKTVFLSFDTITAFRFSLGPAGPIAIPSEISSVPVSSEAGVGWKPIPNFSYPMSLPVIRPEYPCTSGTAENLDGARSIARNRIRYGNPDDLTSLPSGGYTTGTVAVTTGSFVVRGQETFWHVRRNYLNGMVFQVDGDATAYTVMNVVDDEKLILSRGYRGPLRDRVHYAIRQDHFGQLHDYLIKLVAGGPTSGPMATRYLPRTIYSMGTIQLEDRSSVVRGTGTAWNSDLVGLDLQVIGTETGTIQVGHGWPVVIGTGTDWSSDMAGMSLQVASDSTSYTIAAVTSPTSLVLDHHFDGQDNRAAHYKIFERTAYPIVEVISRTELRLARPYQGPNRSGSVDYIIFSALQSQDEGETPTMPLQSPMDLVLLGSLHPAMAQMLGLYWADSSAEEGKDYDYLILADYEGRFKGIGPISICGYLANEGLDGLSGVDGYIVFNKKRESAPVLSPPGDLQAYALPAWGQRPDAPNNAGLTWDLGVTDGRLLPDKAVMAHLWRSDLGENEPTDPPTDYSYHPVTWAPGKDRPVLVSSLLPGLSPKRPADWPPFPMQVVDRELQDGWYSYRISGIDIFGRHSQQSEPASWHQWGPMPDPKPWYYQEPQGDRTIHPFAIRLLDKLPPPPPAGIEAYALDPADPLVVQDAAYKEWQSSLSLGDQKNLIGLRVRWAWSAAHMLQAPDTREFRLYYQPGRLNALLSRILSVSIVSLTESDVDVDIPDSSAARALKGAMLQTGTSSFKILNRIGGTPLRLRVRNIGPHYRMGTISVEHSSETVTGMDTAWSKDLAGTVLQVDEETAPYRIARVNSPTDLTLERAYAGATGSRKKYQIYKAPRSGIPCSLVYPSPHTAGRVSLNKDDRKVAGTDTRWGTEHIGQIFKVAGEHTEYRIIGIEVESTPQHITLDRPYIGRTGSGRSYQIIHPLCVDYTRSANWKKRIHVLGYDEHVNVRIPAKRGANNYPLMGRRATVKGSIVSLENAEDADLSTVRIREDVIYLEDDRASEIKCYPILSVNNNLDEYQRKKVTVGGRPRIGRVPSSWIIGPPIPLRFYEVFLPAPDSAENGDFDPSLENPMVYAHIGISAVDGRRHTEDDPRWAEESHGGWDPIERYGNEGPVSPPASIFRVLRKRPDPPITPPADSDKVYATPADYHGRSFYTYRWQPVDNLKTHIFRALDDAIFKRDWLIRTTRIALDSTLPWHESYFTRDTKTEEDYPWTLEQKLEFAGELNAIESQSDYGTLSDGAKALLALLPGNEGKVWDNGLQEQDWAIRVTRRSLTADHTDYFPEEWVKSNDEVNRLRRQNIADELNAMAALLTGTAATVNDTVVTLSGNPDLVQVRPNRDLLWLAVEGEAVGSEERKRRSYRIKAVDQANHNLTLDRRPNLASPISEWAIYLNPYLELSNDALRVLAGLPGNERAFSQVTIKPMDPTDSKNFDRRGANDSEDYEPDEDLRIYVDTLPGRTASRYFYRASYVDGAQNRSYLSLSGPPVYMPKVTPPRTPVITKVQGGNRQITLSWNCSREPDLVEYRIYRTDNNENARDIRLMTQVHSEVIPSGDPMERPVVMQQIDEVPNLRSWYYRIVAIDVAGNVSPPSKLVTAQAYDLSPPAPPTWRRAEHVRIDQFGNEKPADAVLDVYTPAVALAWATIQPDLKCIVQRRPTDREVWSAVSPWLRAPAAYDDESCWVWSFRDAAIRADTTYVYRIKLVGRAASTYSEELPV